MSIIRKLLNTKYIYRPVNLCLKEVLVYFLSIIECCKNKIVQYCFISQ